MAINLGVVMIRTAYLLLTKLRLLCKRWEHRRGVKKELQRKRLKEKIFQIHLKIKLEKAAQLEREIRAEVLLDEVLVQLPKKN